MLGGRLLAIVSTEKHNFFFCFKVNIIIKENIKNITIKELIKGAII
jgi:hypothetical protein